MIIKRKNCIDTMALKTPLFEVYWKKDCFDVRSIKEKGDFPIFIGSIIACEHTAKKLNTLLQSQIIRFKLKDLN